jgi:uncharacterized membrane protein YecN with MAPEG domain
MQRFKHRVSMCENDFDRLDRSIRAMEKDGWELVSMTNYTPESLILVFKRPV